MTATIKPGSERDWVEMGNDVIQSTQTQINMPISVRNVAYERLKSVVTDIW